MVLSRKSRKSRRVTRHRRGGAGGAANMLTVVGDLPTQITNALTVLPGMNQATVQSNDVVPIANLNIANASNVLPTQAQLTLVQGGGRRRRIRGKGRKGKRGGSFGSVIGQAVVPFSLLAAQQYYGTRRGKRGKKGSRKASRRR
uniref:Uncharacterized protein n=1 Tax=viral metagenome TaxID=1070528 RepID=A0A6C0F391_9ZZZZ